MGISLSLVYMNQVTRVRILFVHFLPINFTKKIIGPSNTVPAYQPETALAIFNRALAGMDIATGKISVVSNSSYSTVGPASIEDIRNSVPVYPAPVCYVLAPYSCTEEQFAKVLDSSGLIKNYILQEGISSAGGNGGNGTTGGSNSSTTVGLPMSTPSSTGVKVEFRTFGVMALG